MPRLDPAVAATRSALAECLLDCLAEANIADDAAPLFLIACSGGADSLSLAAAAAFLAAEPRRLSGRRIRAGAVIVDHGWHADSAAIAERAAQTCRDLGLSPVLVERVATDSSSNGSLDAAAEAASGPEARARTARYAVLDRVAAQQGAVAVLLGHTLDDQAETVLLGLARGSGTRSLAGMPRRRGRYRRPLLDLTRAQTQQACAAQHLTPWQDPANDDQRYTRVRVRSAMTQLQAALGPGLAQALARTAELAEQDADQLDALAQQLWHDVASEAADAVIELDIAALAEATPALRTRVLLQAIRRAGAPGAAVARSHVLAVDALITQWHGQGPVHLPGAVLAERSYGKLSLRSTRPGPV